MRWKLVRGPLRGAARAARTATPAASLKSASGATADFRPLEPGRYTLRLTAGSGSRAASDTVALDALPRNRLVPIDTMVSTNYPDAGIRVGDTTYLLRDTPSSGPRNQYYQVLVLDRKTLGLVSNRQYWRASDLGRDLNGLDSTKLVILVQQPSGYPGSDIGSLNNVVGRIGVPDYGDAWPTGPGTVSAIGVPGMARGDADVNILPNGLQGRMTGYLTHDQHGNFGFVSSAHEEFSFTPKPSDPCTACDDNVGFRIRHLDSRTLAAAAHDGEIFRTGTRTGNATAEVQRLTAVMAAVPTDNVFILESVSNRQPGEPGYRAPVNDGIDRESMNALVDQVQRMGGTRNGFNRIARKSGAPAGGGLTYALVGWKGAGEGAGEEIAAGVDGAPEAPSMDVRVRPDRQSRMRPVEADGAPDSLVDTMLEPPTNAWPLAKEAWPRTEDCRQAAGVPADDPGATRALNWLPSATDETRLRLGSDPRDAYAKQPYKKDRWDALATTIENVKYADVPPDTRANFTEAQFLAGRCQLATEMRWVGNVRDYLDDLASPIANTAVLTYDTVVGIGDKVYKDTEQPDAEATLHWLEFSEILLELAGPLTHEVSSTVAGVMELGVWMFGANENGGPNPELPFKSRELGSELREQMQDAAETYQTIGDVIVTDSAKLAFVGATGGCLEGTKGCPEGWSFSNDDRVAVKADITRGVERIAYEELLPLGFSTYGLNAGRGEGEPDPRWYNCSVYPWWYFSPTAISLATTAEKWELDLETGRHFDLYKVLVLALPGGAAKYFHGKPPSDELLKRMFGPVVDSDDANKGGLGISSSRLMRAAKWEFWAGTPWFRPVRDNCS
jgi:hypothetical protein